MRGTETVRAQKGKTRGQEGSKSYRQDKDVADGGGEQGGRCLSSLQEARPERKCNIEGAPLLRLEGQEVVPQESFGCVYAGAADGAFSTTASSASGASTNDSLSAVSAGEGAAAPAFDGETDGEGAAAPSRRGGSGSEP